MFFFWGPFFFIFPVLFIYYLVRHLMGPGHHRDRSKWIHDFDNFNYPSRIDETQSQESIQVRIYKLGFKLKGRLTVSDIVIETDIGVDEAEKLIQSMVDNQRVRMEVRDDGMVVYEFPEIIARFASEEGFEPGSNP